MSGVERIDRLDIFSTDVVDILAENVPNRFALRDPASGALVELNETAAWYVERLCSGATVGSVATAAGGTFGIDDVRAFDDIQAVVDHLDRIGLVLIRRSARTRFSPTFTWLRLVDVAQLRFHRPVLHRYRPTLLGILRGVGRQSQLQVALAAAAGIVLAAMIGWVNELPLRTMPELFGYALLPMLLLGWHLALLVCHEHGHLVALRWSKTPLYFVGVRGLKFAVVHAPTSGRAAPVVAVAGPAAAAVVGASVGGAFATVEGWSAWGIAVASSGALHLLSLLPWAADGRMLWHGHHGGPDGTPGK
jgi:hypothetical protein